MLRSFFVFLTLGVVGVGAISGLIYLAYERSQPFVLERYVTVQVPMYQQKTELMEVKTEDGKKIKAFVPVSETTFVTEKRKQAESYELTPEQQLRLSIIRWIGVAIFVFFALLMMLWFSYFLRKGGKPPKQVDDLLKYLVTGMLGAFLGFAGSPTGDSKNIPNRNGASQTRTTSSSTPAANPTGRVRQ